MRISDQFRLGTLVTEASHPVTARLSEVAKKDLPAALGLLFQADRDVLEKFREFAASGRAGQIAATVRSAVQGGGRVFFTGCGSSGRLSILLDSIWRDFWSRQGGAAAGLADRTVSVMAGGDHALIKEVEGFEDFASFGQKQLADLDVTAKDVVFAITEGGETPFVIGTAWAGVAAGAKVYFVYNNPDEVLCAALERSREVIQDPRIEKLNLTTGPMSLTGSTRMQATSIQLCVLLTILELVTEGLCQDQSSPPVSPAGSIPARFLAGLEELFAFLSSPEFLAALARLVALEESVYRARGRNSYFAGRFGLDVLTDTTERSPAFGTPPFRKFDDDQAAESWSYLFVPDNWTDNAWANLLKRPPRCLEWREQELRALVPPDRLELAREIIGRIGPNELMRYKIGSNGLKYRPLVVQDSAIAVVSAAERETTLKFQLQQLTGAAANFVHTGVIYFGAERREEILPVAGTAVFVRLPNPGLRLDGVTRVAVKLVMNALSTATLVRLGRVQGNLMVSVGPGNLKLIDRLTRYLKQLTGMSYETANALVFECVEHVESRLNQNQIHPPVVALAMTRLKFNFTNEQAEKYLGGNGISFGPA